MISHITIIPLDFFFLSQVHQAPFTVVTHYTRVPPVTLSRALVLAFHIPEFHHDRVLENPQLPEHLHVGRVGS